MNNIKTLRFQSFTQTFVLAVSPTVRNLQLSHTIYCQIRLGSTSPGCDALGDARDLADVSYLWTGASGLDDVAS